MKGVTGQPGRPAGCADGNFGALKAAGRKAVIITDGSASRQGQGPCSSEPATHGGEEMASFVLAWSCAVVVGF